MTTAPHLRAQHALVRMIYDPAFAAAVRAAPRAALPSLPAELADALAAVDPRALRRDADRRERTLGVLCAELPASTTLALAELGRMGPLLDFYGGAAFHEAIDGGGPLVLALGAHLQLLLAEGALRGPHTAAVLALELAGARARRPGVVAAARPDALRRAAGVEPVEVPRGALAALAAAERHRFRLSLLPWAYAADAPAPSLPPLGTDRQVVCALALAGRVTMVELDPVAGALLLSLPPGAARTRGALLEEATRRGGGDRARLEAALAELIDGELIEPADRPVATS